MKIKSVKSPDGDLNHSIGALDNFWRSAENFYVEPLNGTGNMTWSVSQAAPLRRIYVNGNLNLSQKGYASGGYMADIKVTGTVRSGSQQQWFTRNSEIGHWSGGQWNMGRVPELHF